ncbi:MAG: hypothetical protein QOH57_1746, partial [Mycobacterium sp.]|nr:hypothetical protein [Mycobacterium sp.]
DSKFVRPAEPTQQFWFDVRVTELSAYFTQFTGEDRRRCHGARS